MRAWLNDFRAEVSSANQDKLDFQVWEPTFFYNPDKPAIQKQMVSSEDITQVEIKFFPPPKPGKP